MSVETVRTSPLRREWSLFLDLGILPIGGCGTFSIWGSEVKGRVGERKGEIGVTGEEGQGLVECGEPWSPVAVRDL